MHRFAGDNAALYDLGEPFRFTALPLEDAGDGFTWRAADPALACWQGDVTFGVFEGGVWQPLVADVVHERSGHVEFTRCLTGKHVRADGFAFPASLLATCASWRLEQGVLVGRPSLGGSANVTTGSATVHLDEVSEESWEGLAVVRRVLAVLRSGPAGAFVGLGELVRDAFGVTVMFDNQGVTYAPR